MTNSLLNVEWIAYLNKFSGLIVGFSGGLDSTVLLHILASYPTLRSKLMAVHINHGISAQAQNWQNHCEQLCQQWDIHFRSQVIQFDRARNVEEEARTARYEAFSSLLTATDCLILGHHREDQAETVLLHLLRGAGIDGLSAMAERGALASGEALLRPLLACSRKQLEDYAVAHELSWVEDESNQEIEYARNYLRHQIIPLLKEKWPAAVANIARTATHCQEARANLDELAILESPEINLAKNTLDIDFLKTLTKPRLANVVRVWLKKNQVLLPSAVILQKLMDEVIFASVDASPLVSWGAVQVRRHQQQLYLDRKSKIVFPDVLEWTDFPSPLIRPELNLHLVAKKTSYGLVIPSGAVLSIKFRQGGEKLKWRGHTKQLKKLFQEWEIPPWRRDKIPLLYINDQIAAVIDHAISDAFFSYNSPEAWHVEGLI